MENKTTFPEETHLILLKKLSKELTNYRSPNYHSNLILKIENLWLS